MTGHLCHLSDVFLNVALFHFQKMITQCKASFIHVGQRFYSPLYRFRLFMSRFTFHQLQIDDGVKVIFTVCVGISLLIRRVGIEPTSLRGIAQRVVASFHYRRRFAFFCLLFCLFTNHLYKLIAQRYSLASTVSGFASTFRFGPSRSFSKILKHPLLACRLACRRHRSWVSQRDRSSSVVLSFQNHVGKS